MINSIFLLIAFVFIQLSIHAQNILLPQPQQIVYGKQRVNLKRLTINSQAAFSAEDKFAIAFLSNAIKTKTGIDINHGADSNTCSLFMEHTDSLSALPGLNEKVGPDSRESYQISIQPRSVKITAPSAAGIFYGVQTLIQLIEGENENAYWPEVHIIDWPALAYRGFMVDMSHCQLPNISEIKNQIDFLAKWKVNQYYFYSETSIELDGFPLLMGDAKYSKAQVKEIVAYAKQRCMDVVPIVELYGHLHDLFRLEKYAHLAAIPHGGEFKYAEPQSKQILADWVGQLAPLFPSPFFHIGFDETWLLEGSAKKLKQKPAAIYMNMLQQTDSLIKSHGKQTILWADMLQKYPQIVPLMKKNIIAMPWHYFPMQPNEYKQAFEPFAKAGIKTIAQTAVLNWNWLVPMYNTSFKNTDVLLSEGRKYGMAGFVNSAWTDDTQVLLRLARPDMAYTAAATWQNKPIHQQDFFKNYAALLYPAAIAEKLEKAEQHLTVSTQFISESFGNPNAAFWNNPFSKNNLKNTIKNKMQLQKGRLAAEAAEAYLKEAMQLCKDTITLHAMITGAKLLDYLALKYLYALEINELWQQNKQHKNKAEWSKMFYYEVAHKYHTRTSDMLDAITELKGSFEQAWRNEYQPFRLAIALGKYDTEFQFWWKLQMQLNAFLEEYKAGDPLLDLYYLE